MSDKPELLKHCCSKAILYVLFFLLLVYCTAWSDSATS